ncbi:cobalt transporter [Kosakonia radicincitans DSM 16656]|uniref:Probable cobalt transporter subunit (CbtB) n=1 Tax=Kosakonia radicincitans TaxID=283686 RepID=A0AAX2EL24_9ENTR|nr:CbtB-domain containing protein [Kosakonia radicincitans]MDP9565301.1 type II secretory pathway component PulM [Kosakonia oryzae]ARD62339.1 cobalt transporter [Kosakonia radicincitans DSM 16656]SFD85690.1 Probable cobalt transporter subunit (CbtB) [Kosakonia radicincitans]SFQ95110.1 Probable cobalt transporter subunit (CbtB) [Kosakonia radicincitans]SFT34565.1 Probable cobalt transporter subunit (CbtB) [Kosakonia radicincitans]
MEHTVNKIEVVQAPIPFNAILPWIAFITLMVMLSVYFIGAEQGATAVFSGNQVHEYFHDARHLLGFPCH